MVITPQSMLFASGDLSAFKEHILIEDDVLVGSGVHIYVSNHNFEDPDKLISLQAHQEVRPVRLRRGCWIGAKVTILPGVEIGEHSVVGAGSVVTKSVPDNAVAVGNPCKVKRQILNNVVV